MRYHLMIRDREGLPPCSSIKVGKLEFRRYTRVQSSNPDLPDQIHLGAVGDYSEEQVAACRKLVDPQEEGALAVYVVRWMWGRKADGQPYLRAAQVFDTRLRNVYQPDKNDEPLGHYLQVTPIGPDALVGVPTVPELAEARTQAQRSEQLARQDPTDARTRAAHGRAKARGESAPTGE